MKNIILIVLGLFVGIQATDTLTVDVASFEPMVYRDSYGTLTGFDIEFFNAVADKADLTFKYNEVELFSDLLARVETEESDIALSGITITDTREERVDFSHPYLKSGLSILIRGEANPNAYQWAKIQLGLYMGIIGKLAPLLLVYILYVITAGFLVYVWENWKKFDCAYFVNTVISSTGFGDLTPKTKKGKVLAQILMFSGIGFIFPMLTGTVTSELTAAKFTSYINSPQDLKNKRVCVIKGTTSVDAVKEYGARIAIVSDKEEALRLIRNHKADAFVYDLPGIATLAKNNDDMQAVGVLFDRQDYGIAMSRGSPYRKRINIAILKVLKEDYEKIYKKYLGDVR